MTHPGLPEIWQWLIAVLMFIALLQVLLQPAVKRRTRLTMSVDRIPLLGAVSRFFNASPWPLFCRKLIVAGLFLLVIAAGLFGTPIAERNLATPLTWTI